MSEPAPMRDEASARQVRAARPDVSTWLSANAGAGKTRVLTDRVARLLLQGTDPQSILCLTYTKAAAAEMQNRLFDRLGEWAMLPDDALRQALADLGVPDTGLGAILPRARRLFAAAIETPGGLRIQTIHAFCAGLLRRFPVEAGVTPAFRELDDRGADALLRDVLNETARQDSALFAACATHVTSLDMLGLCAAISRERKAMAQAPSRAELAARIGTVADVHAGSAYEHLVTVGLDTQLQQMADALAGAQKVTDIKLGAKLASAAAAAPDQKLDVLLDVALTKTGTRRTSPITQGGKTCLGPLLPAFEALLDRAEEASALRKGYRAMERMVALHAFAAAFLKRLDAAKRARGVLDFDDLIEHTHRLLHSPGIAEWVLYKLDGGISHVLVDEAQDTAPRQWEIIAKLTEDFTSGDPDPDSPTRTLFVVGDFKQSIYSFQGADPTRFKEMRAHFEAAHTHVGRSLHSGVMEHSFRSAAPILQAVDAVFNTEGTAQAIGGPPRHAAFWEDLPGRVDLWPALETEKSAAAQPWFAPIDAVSQESARFVLARQIADEVHRMIAEEMLPLRAKDGSIGARPIHAGDFLILVQGRQNGLFDAIINACKARGIAVAGADRLKLEGELAVQDVLGTLKFLDTPEDDLSLAAILRSPLFGWSADAVHRLAQGRGESLPLWAALRDGHPDSQAVSVLRDLLGSADFLRPFDLIDRLLVRHKGRARLMARLGPEAEDGLDALRAQALSFEQEEAASLTAFLAWMETGNAEIKRQAEGAGTALRVMTVHGAKGLEAPIVILPDTIRSAAKSVRSELLPNGAGLPLWKDQKGQMTADMEAALSAAQEAVWAEELRLLYVAMTRAENWLILCGAGKPMKEKKCWLPHVEEALQQLPVDRPETPAGQGMRLGGTGWPVGPTSGPDSEPAESATGHPSDGSVLPPHALDPVVPPARAPAPKAPSDLGGAKALPGDGLDSEAAMRRGSALHHLLELLPEIDPSLRAKQAPALLASFDAELAPSLVPELTAEALAVLDAPSLSHLFEPGTLAEVPFAATLPEIGPVHGIIDRLVIREDTVLAVDYKSNAQVPGDPGAVPEGLLRQMGAYGAALSAIYPDHTIALAILWTKTATVMSIPRNLADEALSRASLP